MGYGAFEGWGWGGGGMAFGGLMMVFWLAVLVALVVFIAKWAGGDQNRYRPDALETLNMRLAAGEIDTDEFEELARRMRTRH
ncbi:MAG: hypothetical protein GXP01_10435 [Alphaproteobacteria bacterium]|nr:hypothetical protein [Alphaproteobacteria bacterium]